MMPEIRLSQGTIHYREEGSGPPIVLIHGLLVNGRVWERVVPLLSGVIRLVGDQLLHLGLVLGLVHECFRSGPGYAGVHPKPDGRTAGPKHHRNQCHGQRRSRQFQLGKLIGRGGFGCRTTSPWRGGWASAKPR